MRKSEQVEKSYQIAREVYGDIGVDTEQVLTKLEKIPVSLQCWQGDDVHGFEHDETGGASGGILSTGAYPGAARNAEQLRADLDHALSLIPGKMRVNVHAIYLEADQAIPRSEIKPEHFANWVAWAKEKKIGLDFNPTFFSHPMAASGFTLSSPDPAVRKYWIDHTKACRAISAYMGEQLGNRCVMNIWLQDGFKDIPVDRFAARRRLKESLDEILSVKYNPAFMRDAVESKLFGIGVESCTIGSHEFYMSYALKNNLFLCMDSGHFHPTEVISDKISSALLFFDEILLHVSRPVRWDSDHVVILDDELQAVANESVRTDLSRVNIGLDFFDGSINRLTAWTIGTRSMQKALCRALLEPAKCLKEMEAAGDFTHRLALTEELKTLPFNAVYDYYCLKHGVPVGYDFMADIDAYERKILATR